MPIVFRQHSTVQGTRENVTINGYTIRWPRGIKMRSPTHTCPAPFSKSFASLGECPSKILSLRGQPKVNEKAHVLLEPLYLPTLPFIYRAPETPATDLEEKMTWFITELRKYIHPMCVRKLGSHPFRRETKQSSTVGQLGELQACKEMQPRNH